MTTTPALVPAARRGLFTAAPDRQLRPGTPERPWELWLTGPDTLLPMVDLATALMAAAEHNALAADLDDGSPLQPAGHALVLTHGYAWRREGTARPGAGVAVPSLCWTAACSVCGEAPQDEFVPHHTGPDAAAADAVENHGWHQLPDGWLVCGCDNTAHSEARARATVQDNDHEPHPDQLALAVGARPIDPDS
ncbi:hypothetical protein [Streptomyces sp. NRRL B-24484]|uniref:hypothetical protein n=1 Tax=Streptomyces sp. NRRL B-24484 TaxID=1463833 RepID=UPI0004BF8F96|nr:hypothetical protein [Streptomyces sp. NRRL B-24484]